MAKAIFSGALQEFSVTITEMRGTLEFVRVASHLRPRLGKLVDWGAMDGGGKDLIQNFLNQKSVQPETAYRGLYIVVYGAFEQFVRRVLRDAVAEIDRNITDYDKLDDRIVMRNIALTGTALATINSPPDHVTLDYERICANIGSCRKGATSFTLNADAFALFYANLTPARIHDALERLGVDLNWDSIGGDEDIQKVLGVYKARPAGAELQNRLKEFTRKRNWLAHNGNVGIVISDSDLIELAEFLTVFTSVLCKTVEHELPL